MSSGSYDSQEQNMSEDNKREGDLPKTDSIKSETNNAQALIKKILQSSFDLRGVIFILITSLSYTCGNLVVYTSGQIIKPEAVVLWTTVTINIICIIVLSVTRPTVPGTKSEILFILIHGMCWSVPIVLSTCAIIMINPGTAISIIYTIPIFTLLLGAIIYKEIPHKLHFCFAICVVIGVMFVTKPSWLFKPNSKEESPSVLGIIFALSCALFFSIGLYCARKHKDCPLIITFLASFNGILISSFACIILHSSPIPKSFNVMFMLILNGVLEFVAYAMVALATSVTSESTISIIMATEVPFTWIGQIIFLDLPITWQPIVGATLIFISSVGVIFLKKRADSTDFDNKEGEPLIEK